VGVALDVEIAGEGIGLRRDVDPGAALESGLVLGQPRGDDRVSLLDRGQHEVDDLGAKRAVAATE
jgi:hypothetical protein